MGFSSKADEPNPLKRLCLELVAKATSAQLGGGKKKIEEQHAKGKLTARERIAYLIDQKLKLN